MEPFSERNGGSGGEEKMEAGRGGEEQEEVEGRRYGRPKNVHLSHNIFYWDTQ